MWKTLRLLRWSLQAQGIKGTLRAIPKYVMRLSYRLQEARDGFDAKFGTDTSPAVDTIDLGLTADALRQHRPRMYMAARMGSVRHLLRCLDIRHEEFVFVDYGCGKGRVLLAASELPFKTIIGVELSPLLHETALRNIAQYRSTAQRCSTFDVRCMDMRDFVLPPNDAVVFMYNPCAPDILAEVVANLQEWTKQHGRRLYVLYFNDLDAAVFDRSEGFELVQREKVPDRRVARERYSIYRNRVRETPSEAQPRPHS